MAVMPPQDKSLPRARGAKRYPADWIACIALPIGERDARRGRDGA